jgi:hypothetical protein
MDIIPSIEINYDLLTLDSQKILDTLKKEMDIGVEDEGKTNSNQQ